MTSQGLDADAAAFYFVTLVVLPCLAVLAMRPCIVRLTSPGARTWARVASVLALLAGVWYATISRTDPVGTAAGPLAAVIAFTLLRRFEAAFHRHDVVLAATGLPVFMSLVDLTKLPVEHCLPLAAAVVVAARLLLAAIGGARQLTPAACFSFSPLAMALQTHFLGPRERYDGWPALLAALLLPFLLRLTVRDTPERRRRLRVALAIVIYPLGLYAFATASGTGTATRSWRVDFFEDAQHLAPAGELLRGEKPYRDIVPPHGLLQDGYLNVLFAGIGGTEVGALLKQRWQFGALMAPAYYALGLAATGSPEVGVIACLASGVYGYWPAPRFPAALLALAVLLLAVRLRRTRLMAAAGGAAVLAAFVGVDLGFYTVLAVAFAAFRFGGGGAERMRAVGWSVGGALAMSALFFSVMAAGGYLPDFFRVTLGEIPGLTEVYALTPLGRIPEPLRRTFPDLLASIFDPAAFQYLSWIACAILVAVSLAVPRPASARRSARTETMVAMAAWVTVAGLSYAVRHHTYHRFVVPTLLVTAAFLLGRTASRSARTASAVCIALVVIVSAWTWQASTIAGMRRSGPPPEPCCREVDLPRARGALISNDDATAIEWMAAYIRENLDPDDTFFDFTNRGLLYYLLERDIPVRHIEAAFYESPELQREVIDRLRRNEKVRFVIVPEEGSGVDGVSNDVRAPLVWDYIRQNYEPAAIGPYRIWKRKEPSR